jgi:hypothetical protein
LRRAGLYYRNVVRADNQNEELALRNILRSLRGEKRQRDIADAAGVSLSLYKKLESGLHITAHLENVIRVARGLGAGPEITAVLIRLARPDLARMIAADSECNSSELVLYSLRTFAGSLLQARNGRESVRIAVEALYAFLPPGNQAFAFERKASKHLRLTVQLGMCGEADRVAQPPLPRHFPAGKLYIADHRTVSVAYAPIRANDRILAVLGVVFGREHAPSQKCVVFLETVAALLETRLTQR